jgi:NitT/TauT family transport system substrate-binding protein
MTDVLMVKGDSPIRTGADMNGKTVGIVAMKTLQHAAALAWIDKHGGDSKTVKFVEVPFPEMIGSLDAGRFDVAIPSEPFTTQGKSGNRVLGSCYEVFPKPVLLFGFFATDAWLTANADAAMRFAGAIRQAAVWANGHPLASSTLLTRFTKVDPAIAGSMNRATYATDLEPAMIQPPIDLMVRYGMLPKTIAAADVIWRPGT